MLMKSIELAFTFYQECLLFFSLLINEITFFFHLFYGFLFKTPSRVYTPHSSYYVLITGCSTGIGHQLALSLASQGYSVIAVVRKDTDATILKQSENGSLIHPIIADIGFSSGIDRIIHVTEQLLRAHSHQYLIALINNAACVRFLPLECHSHEEFTNLLNVNISGPFRVTKALLPLLRLSKGRVIFISSLLGRVSIPGLGAYSITKSGVESMADVFRRELHQFDIPVSLIEPGATKSVIWKKGFTSMDESMHSLPSTLQELYQPTIQHIFQAFKFIEKSSIAPTAVLQTVFHSLQSRFPKSRYYVGVDSWFLSLLSYLPVEFSDSLIRFILGI